MNGNALVVEALSGSSPTAAALLAHLELPAPSRLTAPQVRGAHCVWCATPLDGATAVDLGQRYEPVLGVVGRWFPRSCRSCALPYVLAAYKTHWATCEQCVDDETQCDTHRGLRALALELRR
ncbi:hypothetical protein HZZ00_23855 [Streptomyces sp. NEAU-sy36]|uniref:hypothetical protein n=1 Tax=unclassified Streptomyces TaxID=2593676 RepID=UPI0015D60BC0|nr:MULTISPECIES: hypothetical protein [unclassified Streptomyces]QLJ03721.1 hypothetical protein HZZ00_23855 [Streptomyces sp. NEAU-sy36]